MAVFNLVPDDPFLRFIAEKSRACPVEQCEVISGSFYNFAPPTSSFKASRGRWKFKVSSSRSGSLN